MNKIKALLLAAMLMMVCVVPTFADETIATPNKLIVFKIGHSSYYTQEIGSSEVKAVQMDTAPFIKDSRTFVPVRFLGNALGVSDSNITWDNSARKAVLQGKSKLELTIGSKTMLKDGQKSEMDVAPLIADPGRTLLPARYVAEGLGFKVDWDAENQLVIAYPKGQSKPDLENILKKIDLNTQKPGEAKPGEAKQVTIDCYNKKPGTKIDSYSEFIIYASPTAIRFVSKDEKEYRFVCTSHEGLNTALVAPFGQKEKVEMKTDGGYNGEHSIANGLGYLTEIKPGMTINYDIYNEANTKIYEMTFQM